MEVKTGTMPCHKPLCLLLPHNYNGSTIKGQCQPQHWKFIDLLILTSSTSSAPCLLQRTNRTIPTPLPPNAPSEWGPSGRSVAGMCRTPVHLKDELAETADSVVCAYLYSGPWNKYREVYLHSCVSRIVL